MTTSAARPLTTVAPLAVQRVVVALLAALALVVAAVLLTGLGTTVSDSAGASWNKASTSAGASWNTGVAAKSGASWN